MQTTRPDFREVHRLIDGTVIVVRHIRPEDAIELQRAFTALSPSSRYRRFFGGVTALSDQTLRYLTVVDGHDHVALVATSRDPGSGEERGIGVARFVRLAAHPAIAEAAITVLDDFQGRGIGRLLALTLGRAAHERAIERFRGEILANNATVRQLLEELGAELHEQNDGRILFDIPLAGSEEAAARYEQASRRLLRAAADYLVGVLHRFS